MPAIGLSAPAERVCRGKGKRARKCRSWALPFSQRLHLEAEEPPDSPNSREVIMLHRRDFIRHSGAATVALAAPMIVTARARGANERLNVAFIGVGGFGGSNVRYFAGKANPPRGENPLSLRLCDAHHRNGATGERGTPQRPEAAVERGAAGHRERPRGRGFPPPRLPARLDALSFRGKRRRFKTCVQIWDLGKTPVRCPACPPPEPPFSCNSTYVGQRAASPEAAARHAGTTPVSKPVPVPHTASDTDV